MRTLVVTNDFPPRTGGIESFVLEMARRMPPGDVVVHTATQPGDRAFDATLPFPVVRDPSRILLPTPATTRRAADLARAEGCEAVWFGAAAPLGLMAPALRRAGVRRSVATTHGHEVWWSSLPGSRALLRRIGESVDVLTFLGPWCAERVRRPLSPAARARMRRLTPGVDTAAFRPGCGGEEVRRRHGLHDRPVVVCVSRLVARKGQDVLVRALPEVRRAVPGAALLLVGDGPHRPAVERLVQRLGLRGDVVLTGAVPWAQTPAHYDAGDVFCMPARTRLGGLEPEALGICYLEAAACGLPVVAGGSGGAPDAIVAGGTGRVVDGRDPSAVAAALTGYLLDPGLARRHGDAGRAWVSDRWRWDVLALRLQRMLAGSDPDAAPGPAATAGAPPSPPTP
ncbi:phosphatidylinositol alpha-1,6-mannosyltransferase [Kineococcus xinjiangensis]|uniref:Phosphatidylinositol alpha-1,6-mannosyltransferase n=1 Tax=Kineococcus xinjiangensis TaxID=512762 RepID=A0A2S6IM42_9ACTN|nr:glycosyltransferase family 4 protein [Kineococcus xinjiangensis]PPK95289.1 phosphatidylinositol alpha-1,6-mannosyltransferase [Kineococcus xinjiangensis]